SGVDPRRIKDMIRTKAGQPLDNKTLAEDLTRIYGLGIFESVGYTIVPDGSQNTLLISAALKSWGPTYLQAGLDLATDFHVTTEFGVTLFVDATEMNRLGGEWKTVLTFGSPFDFETRFFQPLSYGGHFFLSPFAGWRQYNFQFWNDAGTLIATTSQVRSLFGGIDLGYDFGNFAELRVGYLRGSRDVTTLVGVRPDTSPGQGALTAQLTIDRLDNVSLPHAGYFARIGYFGDRIQYGGEHDYDLFRADAGGAATIGRWTGNLQLEYGSTLGTTVSPIDRFWLGGLFRLSGLPIRSLRGQELALATGRVYYRLIGTGAGILKNISVGGSLEAGNVWPNQQLVSFSNLKTAGSVFVITDTIVGPFFLGYGRSGGSSSFYLYLNRTF
ncbi:MAG TPA: hypothetical protein VMR54_01280, partial [Thermoanaerobaculia bacterium]|nr:hypothetical protein [Thermoanaerobaculia bacterium]